MPNGESTLAAALNSLAWLGTERDREQLLALLDRLEAARLRVLVVGEAKQGKSTLINALLGHNVLADLRAELDVLRDSAAELLGLDLAVPDPEGRLAESRRFFFITAEDVGQAELLAGAVRRRLPGEFGRRAAREHVRRAALAW